MYYVCKIIKIVLITKQLSCFVFKFFKYVFFSFTISYYYLEDTLANDNSQSTNNGVVKEKRY